MNFKEIMEIDRHPFPDNWEESFYERMTTQFNLDIYTLLSILLQQRFLEKFNKKYGADIHVFYCHSSYFLFGNMREMEDYEMSLEFMLDYEENCEELFIDMAVYGYFEIMHMIIDPSEWEFPEYKKKPFIKKKMRKCEPSWRPFIWKNLEYILESCCMEDTEVYILRNRQIYIYQTFCQKFEKSVDLHLKKEREALDAVIADLIHPLYYWLGHSDGYIDNVYYIYFDTGHNGYQFLDMKCLRLTWILSCFVFRMLIDDFKMKVRRIMNMEMEDICNERRRTCRTDALSENV